MKMSCFAAISEGGSRIATVGMTVIRPARNCAAPKHKKHAPMIFHVHVLSSVLVFTTARGHFLRP